MRNKTFTDYIEFLKYAEQHQDNLTNIKFYDGRLYSFNTPSVRCKFICETSAITPNNFVKMLGFPNYNAFTYKCFDHLKDFTEYKEDINKWYAGYYGGLIGINWDKINDYVGDGLVNTFYDYDLNKAYLHALTGWLPTKFIKTMHYIEYIQINEIDRQNYCFFIELEWDKKDGAFLSCLGDIKQIYQSFDFINSKQNKNMIVSELRFELIKQIYFYSFKIKKVYMFEKRRFMFFRNILNAYCEQKENYGEDFKRNALRLYGTFGQIYKKKVKKLHFEKSIIRAEYEVEENLKASPQVAMWVADSVALKLFTIISQNLDSVISWNTDGLTTTKPIKRLQLGTQPGKWKLNKIIGTPFLLDEVGQRVFYKDVKRNKIFGADTIIERNGYFDFCQEFKFSNTKKGYVKKTIKTKILPTLKFDRNRTLRNLILINELKEVQKDYERF